MGAVCMDITTDFLGRLLGLPEGQYVGAIAYNISRDVMQVRICGTGLPEVAPGQQTQWVNSSVEEIKTARVRWEKE